MPTVLPPAPAIEIDEGSRCAECGYSLRGLTEPRCPECGLAFDPDISPPADIPWLARHEIGNVTAYLRTICLVLLQPKHFAEQVWRTCDVNPVEAERFRRVTIGLATLSMLTVIAMPILASAARWSLFELLRTLGALICFALPIFVFFWIATLRLDLKPAQGSFPEKLRFGTLQHFACAGLGLAPIIALSVALSAGVDMIRGGPGGFGGLVLTAMVAVTMAWWVGLGMFHVIGGRLGMGQFIFFVMASIGLCGMAVMAALVSSVPALFVALFLVPW